MEVMMYTLKLKEKLDHQPWGREGTPIYKPYKNVLPQKVSFSSISTLR